MAEETGQQTQDARRDEVSAVSTLPNDKVPLRGKSRQPTRLCDGLEVIFRFFDADSAAVRFQIALPEYGK